MSTYPQLLFCLVCLLTYHRLAADSLKVTCGSVIKLQHVATKFRLHSHEVGYSRGSQQQSVTAFASGDDANSHWSVHGEEACLPGTPIKKNSKLKFQHVATRKWLHSHLFYSPLSNNQEVSAYGDDSSSDGGDLWVVEWDSKNKVWKQDNKIRLRHVDTNGYLYSHEYAFGNPIAGQHEVCAVAKKDRNAEWQAAEGVYFPVDKPVAAKDEL